MLSSFSTLTRTHLSCFFNVLYLTMFLRLLHIFWHSETGLKKIANILIFSKEEI